VDHGVAVWANWYEILDWIDIEFTTYLAQGFNVLALTEN